MAKTLTEPASGCKSSDSEAQKDCKGARPWSEDENSKRKEKGGGLILLLGEIQMIKNHVTAPKKDEP